MSDRPTLGDQYHSFITDPAQRVGAPLARFCAHLHEEAPVLRVADGLWLISSYEQLVRLWGDDRLGVDPSLSPHLTSVTQSGYVESYLRPMFSLRDPPDHTRLRSIVQPAFSPRALARIGAEIEALLGRLFDLVEDGAPIDLIGEVAKPVPVHVSCMLFGVPFADARRVVGWTELVSSQVNAFGQPPDRIADVEASLGEMVTFVERLCAERRRAPKDDDLLSSLVVARDNGTIDDHELIATCILLLISGYETATHLIGNSTLALLDHPEALAAVRRSPDAITGVLQETLRLEAPVRFAARTATQDIEGEVEIREGDTVLGFFAAANRDPRKFVDPDRFDIERDTVPHLAFGHGTHFCLGHALGMLEGRAVLAGLVATFARMELAVRREQLEWSDSLAFHGLDRLPLRLAR